MSSGSASHPIELANDEQNQTLLPTKEAPPPSKFTFNPHIVPPPPSLRSKKKPADAAAEAGGEFLQTLQFDDQYNALKKKAEEFMKMEEDSLIIFSGRTEKWLTKQIIGKERSNIDNFL